MLEEEAAKLARMEDELKKRIVGQDEAVKRSPTRSNVRAPASPIRTARSARSFSSVLPAWAKTELTKALAEFLFNDDKALIRVDMSEFMEKHSVSRLIGAPPGYVGHDEGGGLTEMVRHRPYSVILFDEIEKAHPEVFNILLQVLDNGRLTDTKGRTVNFKNTVIIMTSNIGAQYIQRMEHMGFNAAIGEKTAARNGQSELRRGQGQGHGKRSREYLPPGIPQPRGRHHPLRHIVKGSHRKDRHYPDSGIVERSQGKDINLVVAPEVFAYLAKEGYNPQYGARPLKRLIQNKILTPVAGLMISQGITKGGAVNVVDEK